MEDGSSAALEAFLASVERRAFRIAQLSTRSTDDALDIVQDAMCGLVQRYARKPPSDWKPLFYRILVSRIRDWHRRRAVRRRWQAWLHGRPTNEGGATADPIEALPAPSGDNPAEAAIRGDAREALAAAFDSLPPRQQQAFLLRAWEGLSVKETASAMRCTAGSVKTHYSRAVHALRHRLGEHWS